ncbi:MAG: hypothetical protein AB1696_27965 [Planctomycetota bacterium]
MPQKHARPLMRPWPRNAGQRLQLKVDALETMNSVIGTVAKKAKLRTDLLDKYLEENGLAEAYLKASKEMPERAPKTAAWTKREGAQEDVPLSIDDAFQIAIECELEDRMDEIRAAEPKDVEGMERALKANRELAEKRFAETLPQMIAVDRKIAFLQEQGHLEKARVWATGELERQKAEAKQEKEEKREAAKSEEDAKRQEQLARAEKAREKRAEKIEQRWQRQTEAYSLRTEREKAERGTDYRYGWPW